MPPETRTCADPFVPPLQVTEVALMIVLSAAGCVIVTEEAEVHPFASVAITEYTPEGKPDALAVFCTGVEFQLYT